MPDLSLEEREIIIEKYFSEMAEITERMIIPQLEGEEIIFIVLESPGVVFIGLKDHMMLERLFGNSPREISWEQAVHILNSDDWFGKTSELCYCLPITSNQQRKVDMVNESIPFIPDDILEEIA